MSAAAPVRAQQAIEALARLDAAYSRGAEMPWSDLGIVLEFARQQAAVATNVGPVGGRVQVPIGATVTLMGTDVQVTNAGVHGAAVTLEYRAPAEPASTANRTGPCDDCGRPFSPSHDIGAPGNTSRHAFRSRWPAASAAPATPRGVCT